jgi:hypothetical protein
MKKQNRSLIIGFSLPIAMIVFVAASIYVPSFFVHPAYNFLYSSSDENANDDQYLVVDDHVQQNRDYEASYYNPQFYPQPKLYIYDTNTNESIPVTFEEAKNYTLISDITSPDGYTIENGRQNNGGFFFLGGGTDYTSKYLVGHNISKKLNLKSSSTRYSNSTEFLGWIKK